LRLWLRSYQPAVLFGSTGELGQPAMCPRVSAQAEHPPMQQRLGWRPDIVVGDLGYITSKPSARYASNESGRGYQIKAWHDHHSNRLMRGIE